MPVTSTIIVEHPVDAYQVFAAARAAAGVRRFDGRWDLHDFGAVHMLQTLPDQGAFALVSVRFPVVNGALLPSDQGAGEPAGYVQLAFDTDGTNREASHHLHRDLVHRVGVWLTDRRLRWSWTFEARPWESAKVRRKPAIGGSPASMAVPGRGLKIAWDRVGSVKESRT